MESIALLITAILFGGSVLYSFGFAGFLFSALPSEVAGKTLRRAFPHFYSFVIASSLAAAVLLGFSNLTAALVLAAIAASTIPTRQLLMPAINRATDQGNKRRFTILHSLSVGITLGHIGAAAYVLLSIAWSL